MTSILSWECVGHSPTLWQLGVFNDGCLSDCVATVRRRSDGKWDWWISSQIDSGIEPSRETAMVAAEEALSPQ